MKRFAVLVGGICLLSASMAWGQSRDPRGFSRDYAAAETSRGASGKTRYFIPAVPTPIPVIVEPSIRVSEVPVIVHSAARVTAAPTISATTNAGCAPLQVSIPESLLNRLLADERSEIAPVRDVIAKADVIGRQTTDTRVVVDVKPNNGFAEIHLVLTGAVHSDTVGVTSQAAVKTFGRHDVQAIKPVMFDGHQITTKKPRVWVDVHNEHVAAATPYDGTLFGGMARSTAIRTANKRRAEIDAETGDHLAAQLGPQFNREADRQLAQFNREWRDNLRSRFGDLWPQRVSARSTESELVVSAAWTDAPEIKWSDVARSGSSSNREISDDTVKVWMHESVLNAWLRNLDLGGKALTETELRETLESFVKKLGGKVIAPDKKLAGQPLPGTAPLIRLGKQDPVRVRIADGELLLIVVAGLEVAGQTVLAQDEITVPFAAKQQRGQWRITPGELAFAKADNGITLAGMVETVVRNQLAAAFPDIVLPDSISLPSTRPTAPLRLARTEAASGWLTLTMALATTATAQPMPEPRPDEYVPLEVVPPRLIGPRLD